MKTKQIIATILVLGAGVGVTYGQNAQVETNVRLNSPVLSAGAQVRGQAQADRDAAEAARAALQAEREALQAERQAAIAQAQAEREALRAQASSSRAELQERLQNASSSEERAQIQDEARAEREALQAERQRIVEERKERFAAMLQERSDLVIARIALVDDRLDQIVARITQGMADLESQGVDVSQAQESLDLALEAQAQVAIYRDELVNLFTQAQTAEDAETARTLLAQAKETGALLKTEIRTAYDALKQAVESLKASARAQAEVTIDSE